MRYNVEHVIVTFCLQVFVDSRLLNYLPGSDRISQLTVKGTVYHYLRKTGFRSGPHGINSLLLLRSYLASCPFREKAQAQIRVMVAISNTLRRAAQLRRTLTTRSGGYYYMQFLYAYRLTKKHYFYIKLQYLPLYGVNHYNRTNSHQIITQSPHYLNLLPLVDASPGCFVSSHSLCNQFDRRTLSMSQCSPKHMPSLGVSLFTPAMVWRKPFTCLVRGKLVWNSLY